MRSNFDLYPQGSYSDIGGASWSADYSNAVDIDGAEGGYMMPDLDSGGDYMDVVGGDDLDGFDSDSNSRTGEL
eukprot:m.656308 g.656308  ORF g.656308 m.656308 type:complete len:73 (-) comp22702_c0_seq5:2421-2639(-)